MKHRAASRPLTQSRPLDFSPWAARWCLGSVVTAAALGLTQAQESAPKPEALAAQPAQVQRDLTNLSLEELMNVRVTTVSREESTVGQTPAAVFVITQEMIRRSGAKEIPELFRMVPGMNVARIDNNKWAVGVRGFNERFQDKLLVQVDGRTVYNPIFSGVYWDTVDYPLEDIERIEVVRGPGGSVWGANAVNGVINIITKPAKDTQGGLLSTGGGTEETAFGTLRYGGSLGDDVSFRIFAKGSTRDNTFSVDGDPNDDWWSGSGGLRVDWRASATDAVTFDAGYFHSDAGRKDLRALETEPFTFINEEAEVSNGAHVSGRWTHTISADSSWALQAYWDTVRRQSANILDFRWDTYDVDFQRQFRWGSAQNIVWGAAYRAVYGEINPSPFDDGFNLSAPRSERLMHTYSAFIQDEITLAPDKLFLTLGTKVEHNDFTGVEVQPTGRVLWTPTARQSVWAAFSRAVRTPSLTDDEFRFRLPSISSTDPVYPQLVGNAAFASEEVLAYELGYRTQATEKLSLDLALFYNDYDELRVRTAGEVEDGFISIYPDNLMAAQTYGAELSAVWQIAPTWRLHAAYTFLQMNLHADPSLPASTQASAEAAEGRSAAHQVYLQSSWDLPGNLEFDLIGRFVDAVDGFNPSGTAGVSNLVNDYFSLDLRLAWRPDKHWEISVVGQNLLDDHHQEFGTDSTLSTQPVEFRRGVYAQATYRW